MWLRARAACGAGLCERDCAGKKNTGKKEIHRVFTGFLCEVRAILSRISTLPCKNPLKTTPWAPKRPAAKKDFPLSLFI